MVDTYMADKISPEGLKQLRKIQAQIRVIGKIWLRLEVGLKEFIESELDVPPDTAKE